MKWVLIFIIAYIFVLFIIYLFLKGIKEENYDKEDR